MMDFESEKIKKIKMTEEEIFEQITTLNVVKLKHKMLQIEYLTAYSKTCKSSLIQKERKQLDFKRKLTFRSRISQTSHHLKSAQIECTK